MDRIDLPRSTDTDAIDLLERTAVQLGLDPMTDIGELVLDVADHYGTQAANSADSEREADETINNWSLRGSDVNNNGLRDQLAVLMAFHGVEEANDVLRRLR